MHNKDQLPPALEELTSALGRLAPAEVSIDRDRMMFLAGRRSARRGQRFWPCLTTVLTISLCISMLRGFGVERVDRTVPLPKAQLDLAVWESRPTRISWQVRAPAVGEASYLKLRQEVLAHGLDALPVEKASSSAGEPPLMIEGLLGRPAAWRRNNLIRFGDRL